MPAQADTTSSAATPLRATYDRPAYSTDTVAGPADTHRTILPARLTRGDSTLCRLESGPLTRHELLHTTVGTVPYMLGIMPEPRKHLPGYDSGVVCLLIGLFLLLSYNFRHYSTFLKNFLTDLLSTRRREGTFEVSTFSETGVLVSVVMVACLSQGIIINSWLSDNPSGGMLPAFPVIGGITLAGILYYLWQLAAYATVGYVFTDKTSARLWLKGFNASQALLAFMLIVPALVVLFNPGVAPTVVAIGAGAYIFARFLFICKGFRLFYDNFGSLLYFILYLCTLEITPLIVIYRIACLLQQIIASFRLL